jgi:CheY-like chemotaxis protein
MLLVDDDPVVRKLGMFAFGKIGQFDVRQAASGEQALTMLAETQPMVVVLDVMMPGMDGPETFKQIKAKYPAIPVIFLTGQETPGQLAALKSLGPAGVLGKPFDPREIGKTVHGILDKL